jgi:hypothetical protein
MLHNQLRVFLNYAMFQICNISYSLYSFFIVTVNFLDFIYISYSLYSFFIVTVNFLDYVLPFILFKISVQIYSIINCI